jgi:hypothetical protein
MADKSHEGHTSSSSSSSLFDPSPCVVPSPPVARPPCTRTLRPKPVTGAEELLRHVPKHIPAKKRPVPEPSGNVYLDDTPVPVPKKAPPPQAWYTSLMASLKNLSSLTSDSPEAREAAIRHSNRAPDVMTPAEAVLSDDDLARQWQMRYSEDNVKMPGFQINDVITIVMGMPVLVFICVT